MPTFVNTTWKAPTQWQREGMPASAFLDPKERKYPVKKTARGPYYVRALVAASHYAKMYGDKTVYNKAMKLLNQYKRALEKKKKVR
jgi:hypothetical protein